MDITTEQYDELLNDTKALKMQVQELNDIVINCISSYNLLDNCIEERHLGDGIVTSDKITMTLDDIPDGISYGRLLGVNIEAGQVLLSRASGNLDDIADGTYGKLLSTSLSSGLALLSACDGDLDDITNGTTYGKVNITNISAGNILLVQCTGDLDDIGNGTTYGKVALTSISAGKIIVAGLDSGITDRMFADLNTKNNIQAWRHTSDVTLIDAGAIYTNSLTLASAANDFNWSTLGDDGNKPTDNADVTGSNIAAAIVNLPATPAGAGLYASGIYLGYYDGTGWKSYIQNDGKFYFTGDANNYIQWNGTNLAIKGSITISGGSGIANLTDAGNLATQDSIAYTDTTGAKPPTNADYFAGSAGAMAYENTVENAKLGTTIVSGGYLRTDLIKVKKVYVGAGSNEDIYFEDSGIRMYDGLSGTLYRISLYKDVDFFRFQKSSSTICQLFGLATLQLVADAGIFNFYTTGTLQMPTLTSAPTAHRGDFAYEGSGTADADNQLHFYTDDRWETCSDIDNW